MADYEDLQAQIAELRAHLGSKPAPKKAPGRPKKAVSHAEEEVVYEEPPRAKPAPKPAPARVPRGVANPSDHDDRISSPRFGGAISLRPPVRSTEPEAPKHKCNCKFCPMK